MIELECPVVGCNHGVAGEKYKMPKLDLYDAMSFTDTYGNLHLVRGGVKIENRERS